MEDPIHRVTVLEPKLFLATFGLVDTLTRGVSGSVPIRFPQFPDISVPN